ncbi:MAG: hypothetical protein JEZ09_12385 [Salinivirgaceae bacterium]|nr:hypothetical protein [Salinivirgaceae bacterium]
MNKIIRKFVIIGVLMILVTSLKAQSPLSLYYLENIPQSSFINPAMAPRANAFIGFPLINSVYTAFRSDLLGPNFVQEVGPKGYLLIQNQYDFDKLYRGIGKAANFGMNQSFTLLSFGFSGKKGYFTFGITEKISGAFNVPKSIFEMVESGFPNGGTLDFSPLGFNASYYREYMAGYSYQFTSKIRVGAHVKLLQGLFSAKTDLEKFDLYTSEDRWSVDMRGTVYTSAPLVVTLDENGVPTKVEQEEMETADYIDYGLLNFKNPGLAFDIGAVYDFSPDWTFSASLNDLGFIRWGSNLHSFSVNGRYQFEGFEVDISDIDNMDTVINEMVDSLENALNYGYGHKGFSSGLGPQLYMGAKYNLNYYLNFGVLSRTVFKKYDFQQEFNVSANVNLYHVLTTSINYTVAISGANSMGFGMGLRGGPMEFYMLLDYIPTSYRNYIVDSEKYPGPTSFESFNIMWGLNIMLGANGFKDTPMIDAYSEF